jgi:hypothetical protein
MTIRFTRQGCKVTTTFDLHNPSGSYTEHVTLECVTPLELAPEESPGVAIPQRGRGWRHFREAALDSGAATRVEVPGKHIYLKELS